MKISLGAKGVSAVVLVPLLIATAAGGERRRESYAVPVVNGHEFSFTRERPPADDILSKGRLELAGAWCLATRCPLGKEFELPAPYDKFDKAGESRASAVAALIELMADKEQILRIFAMKLLGWLGADAAIAVPRLANALKDDDELIRMTAVPALGWIGPAAQPAVPALLEAIDPKNQGMREGIAQALGDIEDKQPAVVEALQRLAKDPEKAVRKAAERSLKRIAPQP